MSQQILPQSLEVEKGLICSFLNDPTLVGAICAQRRVGPDAFAVPVHQAIYGHLVAAWQSNEPPVDFVTLTEKLRNAGQMEGLGPADITGFYTFVGTAANAERYVEIIKSKQSLRRIILACQDADQRSFQEEEPEKIISSLSGVLSELGSADADEIPSMAKNVNAATLALQNATSANPNGVLTGLKALDVDVGPMERGNLLVIGGQRKAGKSILASQIALNIALEDHPVLFFSLEMNEQELTMRMLSSMARVETRKVRLWNEGEYQRFSVALPRLAKTPMHIVCRRYDLADIAGISRQFHARYAKDKRLACIVLDYAQLVSVPSRSRDDRRQQEVAAVSRMAKRLASELEVLFVLLTQLNDDGRAREARDIEMDANIMLEVGCDEKSGTRGVRVVCARSAPSGELLKLTIIPHHTRVEDSQ